MILWDVYCRAIIGITYTSQQKRTLQMSQSHTIVRLQQTAHLWDSQSGAKTKKKPTDNNQQNSQLQRGEKDLFLIEQ